MERPAERLDPSLVFQAFIAYQKTAALRAAIETGLFGAVGAGARTARDVAAHCRVSERGARILCDYLVVHGFLNKDAQGYALAPIAAAFLDPASPGCIAPAIGFLGSPMLRGAFDRLTDAVRAGHTTIGGDAALAPEHPMWVEFARSMAPIAALSAELLANRLDAPVGRRRRVLDVAAGHGLFGIAIARRDPDAEVVALDWPNVLTVAEENARSAGVADRVRMLPGSALTLDYGGPYDLILLTNFLHHFDVAGCETILRKVHGALAPAGRAVALEFVPDENRVTPADAGAFALVMLAMTPGGDAYTFDDYQGMFARTGFSRTELHDLPPSFQRVVIAHA